MPSALRRHGAAFALLALGLVFVLIGLYRNEAWLIMQKAIYICLECIGIG